MPHILRGLHALRQRPLQACEEPQWRTDEALQCVLRALARVQDQVEAPNGGSLVS